MPDRYEAFRRQARSDLEICIRLLQEETPACHFLHYLQMSTEKLCKAIRTAGGEAGAEQQSHVAIVKALRLIRNRRQAAAALTEGDVKALRSVIDRCLSLANDVERLAPALARGGLNPEYPWRANDGDWIVPAEFPFPLARRVQSPEGKRYTTCSRG